MARGRLANNKAPARNVKSWEGLSSAEKTFVQVLLDTANERHAYIQAFPDSSSSDNTHAIFRLLHDPRIENNVYRELTTRMLRGAILGTKILTELALDEKVQAQTRLLSAKMLRDPYAWQMRNTQKVSSADLSLSEQSIDQLRELVNQLEGQRGDQAKTINGADLCANDQQDIDLLKELEP